MKYQFVVVVAFILSLTFGLAETGTSQWVSTNGPSTNKITCFSVNGNNLIAGAQGGIFLTSNAGGTWLPLKGNLPNPIVEAIAVSGTNVFVATNGGGGGGGIDLSSNGGDWTNAAPDVTIPAFFSLAFSGSDLVAGTDGAIFKSSDNGGKWQEESGFSSFGVVTSLVASGQEVLAGTGVGLYLSGDGGTSWSQPTTTSVNSIYLGGFYSYIGTNDGVYATTNAGAGWQPDGSGLSGTKVTSIVGDGSNLYAGTDTKGVYFSSDNGNTWKPSNTGLPTLNINALAVDGTFLVAGTDANGVWKRPLSDFGNDAVSDQKQNEISISLSPNPTAGMIAIHSSQENILKVTVRNILGQDMGAVSRPNSQEVTIDLSKVPAGTYVATITSAKSVTSKMIVRE